MAEDIYRIISFPAFVNFITMKEDRFVNPLQWEDTHEGLYYTILNKPDKCDELLNRLYCEYPDLNIVVSTFLKIYLYPYKAFSQCWSREAESDALWRIYSYDNMSVQIHTTVKDLREHINSYLSVISGKVIIKNVKYDLKGTTDEMFKSMGDILLKKKDFSDPFFHKRRAFQHEKEKRVLIVPDIYAQLYKYFEQKHFEEYLEKVCPVFNEATIDHIKTAFQSFLEERNINYNVNNFELIPITNLSKYIKSVKLNPFAPDWIDELMARLCSQNGLNYEGRSKLYEKV